MSIRTENKLITPEMASIWLKKNKRNRAINYGRVKMYANEMRQGRWLEHHQGIAFYDDGTLADGQHRLAAIELANIPVVMSVSWGIPFSSGLMIDGHQQRRVDQAIKISGLADWINKDIIAASKIMMQCEVNTMGVRKISNQEVIDYCNAHKSALQFGDSCFTSRKRFLSTAVTRTSLACASYYEDKERLKQFAKTLLNGMPESSEDKAVILMREFLLTNMGGHASGSSRIEVVRRCMRAIKSFCERKALGRLFEPKDVIYPPINEG